MVFTTVLKTMFKGAAHLLAVCTSSNTTKDACGTAYVRCVMHSAKLKTHPGPASHILLQLHDADFTMIQSRESRWVKATTLHFCRVCIVSVEISELKRCAMIWPRMQEAAQTSSAPHSTDST